MPNSQNLSVRKLYFKDTSFANLMKHRIYNVLLISDKYDTFILEEDGRIEEQIFNEYMSLNLRYPPRFTIVETKTEALNLLEKNKYELLIVMSDSEGEDLIDLSKNIKTLYPSIPLVVLTPFLRDISVRFNSEDLSFIDYFFCWLGNFELLLAIIKLIEDKMNVDEDIESVGVQVILFIEDSVRQASSILPYIYKFVFVQSRSFMTEALNEHQQMLRMRGRPKILLARSYEEALSVYKTYEKNILGVISDVDIPRNGMQVKKTGIDLYKIIAADYPFMPYVLISAESDYKSEIESMNVTFIDKNKKNMSEMLKDRLLQNFGFGDFLFRDPKTWEVVARASTLKDLQKKIYELPDESLLYHVSRNHISRWLYSRAMFPLASFLEILSVDDFGSLNELKDTIHNAIVQYRKIKNRGVVAVFKRERFDKYSNFARIGSGSMGGKGRGLAFLDTIIKNNPQFEDYESKGVQITLPKTVVLCTDVFDEFMEINNLYPIALSDISDEEMLEHFQKAKLPRWLIPDFLAFFNATNTPIAVRSSSLLEDSYYQPFAGVYSTYMIPFAKTSKTHMLNMLKSAIKAVYASVFYKESKAYMDSTSHVIDSEKMAIILQEVVGVNYEDKRFYPSFSGVLRSVNFYPIDPEKPEDGVCNIALGLGKYVVDGSQSLRFSPMYPNKILQTSDISIALRETQNHFYAINLEQADSIFKPSVDDAENLLKCGLKTAEEDGSLRLIGSTYDYNDQMIRDGIFEGGRKIITFANILNHDAIPLAEILQQLMKIGQRDMGHPVEIEFAATLGKKNQDISTFCLLQIRPIVTNKEALVEDFSHIDVKDALIYSNRSLGNGTINGIYDIVYINPKTFDPANNRQTAEELGELNKKLLNQGRNYILIGPGRWGSSDSWLGIPVKWSQISAARVIVESGLANYRIDPSQGTHFFHNLTSLQVAYLTINPFDGDGGYDLDYLNSLPCEYEIGSIRHVKLEKSVIVKINGKTGKSIITRSDNK